MATTKLYVIYYSVYGHVVTIAREIQRGANSVDGVEATLWQVPETLSDSILTKMKAPSKEEEVPVIMPEQLVEADGFLFGSPSRFGMMAAQFLAFFAATHELWASQALAGKPAGIFWSTGFHGGGQELTAFTAITQLAHHGMLFVPLGYTFGSGMFEMDEVKGGSSYGAGTYAGDGSRVPTELELQQAFYQEYGMGGQVSTQGDMYSYGILLLEMFTGRRPTDERFKDGLSLYSFVATALPDRVVDVVDPILLSKPQQEDQDIGMKNNAKENREETTVLKRASESLRRNVDDITEEVIVLVMRIGLACCAPSPKDRMVVRDVLSKLIPIRDSFVGSPEQSKRVA